MDVITEVPQMAASSNLNTVSLESETIIIMFCHFWSVNTFTIDLVWTSSFRSAFVVLSRGLGGGWVGEINNKDHLSPAEAGRWAELGNYIDKRW